MFGWVMLFVSNTHGLPTPLMAVQLSGSYLTRSVPSWSLRWICVFRNILIINCIYNNNLQDFNASLNYFKIIKKIPNKNQMGIIFFTTNRHNAKPKIPNSISCFATEPGRDNDNLMIELNRLWFSSWYCQYMPMTFTNPIVLREAEESITTISYYCKTNSTKSDPLWTSLGL